MSKFTKRRAQLLLHIFIGVALIGIFLFGSAPITYHAVLENKIGPVEPNQSIDVYLQTLTGLRNGSQRLTDVFQQLPKGKPLVILVRKESSPSDFLGMLVAYLCWPHEVRIIKVQSASAESEVMGIEPSSVAGLIFCSIEAPPSLGEGIHLGSGILLFSVAASDVKQ